MKLEEAKNRQANILDKLETLNKALKEGASLGLIFNIDLDNITQLTMTKNYSYPEIRVSVCIRPSNVEL